MQEYKDYQKLIYKMAWKMHYKTGLDIDEFIAEFNLVFVESNAKYIPEIKTSFSSYLCGNIIRRFCNMMASLNCKRNKNIISTDELPAAPCYELMDSILIRDSFFNSKNPVILSIAEIICSEPFPSSSVKIWLREKLYKLGFQHKQITEAFSILRDVIDPEVVA